MSSPYTPSGTPATDRRYARSSAPPSSGPRGRFSRPMKAALALAALAALIVAIVPAAVVTTRDDDSGPEQANALGYTTTINGVETFVQTATAAVVTRQSFTTLADGQVSTVQQQLTLPVVTVSATAFDTVQAGFETVTIDGQQVIVATRTEYLAGAKFVVTRTATGAAGVATILQTVFEDVTVIGCAEYNNNKRRGVVLHYDADHQNYFGRSVHIRGFKHDKRGTIADEHL